MRLLAIPNLAQRSLRNPPQCRGGIRDVRKARRENAAAGSAGRAAGGLRRNRYAGRRAHGGFLRALRRPAARPKEWATPPWQPVLRDGRIYARSASDDKAPIIAIAAALDALQCRRHSAARQYQIRFRRRRRSRIAAPGEHSCEIQRTVGERCLADLRWSGAPEPAPADRFRRTRHHRARYHRLRAKRELHSGHYGNWAPNPGHDAGAAAGLHERRQWPRAPSIISTMASSR